MPVRRDDDGPGRREGGGHRLPHRLGPAGEGLPRAGGGRENREEGEQGQPEVQPSGPVSLVHAASAARSLAAGSGRRKATSAAASAGSTATAAASGIVCGRSNIVSGGGTGVCAVGLRVTAGTSNRATTVPRSRPSAAAGTDSSSFSRNSCAAADR